MESNSQMRKEWFAFVRKTRARMKRATKTEVSHRDAMKHASTLWQAEKVKVLRRIKRDARKRAKADE